MLAVTLVLLVSHGGCRTFHGPSGGVPPGWLAPTMACKCDAEDCAVCTPASPKRYRFTREVETVQRWGDVALVAVTYCFHTIARDTARTGLVKVEPAPLFAPVDASIRRAGFSLKAGFVSKERKDSLAFRIVRRGPGRHDLRLYPIAHGAVTWAEVTGYVVLPKEDAQAVRLYRQGSRVLAVGRHPALKGKPYGFFSSGHAKKLWPGGNPKQLDCIRLLEAAHRGCYPVSRAKAPRDWQPLVAGNQARRLPTVSAHAHEPLDPAPPPPPEFGWLPPGVAPPVNRRR